MDVYYNAALLEWNWRSPFTIRILKEVWEEEEPKEMVDIEQAITAGLDELDIPRGDRQIFVDAANQHLAIQGYTKFYFVLEGAMILLEENP